MGQTLSRLLCTVFGYFYPAYASFKAVKSEDRSLHSFWLTYWIVYVVDCRRRVCVGAARTAPFLAPLRASQQSSAALLP